ncbi:hypothetical protein NX801_14945 [Streptomyces sp. LP05-1]|uniref:BioF2-like acetyltransferase domain-containing protein n=1 Tax=Streptomyces pyxinae TaxID=2970734 RepID=A0ABT2CHQ8_9ACTN|nr:hypothetical protein [Streptomyces sp. LP05-1]MCS0636933.1 hypothetical protein [Streptomyces sp. LP05-1]
MHSDTVSPETYAEIVTSLPVPVWNSPLAVELYGNTLNVVCRSRRGRTAGVWVCPLDAEGEGAGEPAARRGFRLLPYASPWVDPGLHPVDRHRTVVSLVAAVMERVTAIDLPMDPRFGEVAALAEAGAEALCRHTRMLDLRDDKDPRESYVPKVRNHLRAAGREVDVDRAGPESFDFSRAVVGQPEAAVAARRRSGLRLGRDQDGTVHCLAATDREGVCRGQVFVLRCDGADVLMHSWFDRTGPRGVPSLLVDAAVARAVRDPGTDAFDFEGSVIPSIDHFMTGFGARAHAYPQLLWRRSAGSSDGAREFG